VGEGWGVTCGWVCKGGWGGYTLDMLGKYHA